MSVDEFPLRFKRVMRGNYDVIWRGKKVADIFGQEWDYSGRQWSIVWEDGHRKQECESLSHCKKMAERELTRVNP
jgi:hypothetical protein